MKLATLLSLGLLPFAFACAAETSGDKPQASKRDAGRALSTASTLLESIDTESTIRSALPGASGTVDFTAPCPTSGSIELDGTFEISDDGHSEFDVTAGFLACAVDSEQLDGSVHWTETLDGDDYTATLTGTLAWQGPGGSASCTFDVAINNGTITGTACGYDVAELDE
jgi:hypothetical protein